MTMNGVFHQTGVCAFLIQYGGQLLQDYEDTKAEFPWLQLEEENLDTYAKMPPPDTLHSKDPRMSLAPGDPKILVREVPIITERF